LGPNIDSNLVLPFQPIAIFYNEIHFVEAETISRSLYELKAIANMKIIIGIFIPSGAASYLNIHHFIHNYYCTYQTLEGSFYYLI
jgi:hypothetical protein